MRRLVTVWVLLMLASAALAVLAQEAPKSPAAEKPEAQKPMFDHVDSNGDRAITPGEEKASRLAEFKDADKNSDGKLTPDEHAALLVLRQETMDANRDGSVTQEEIVLWAGGKDCGGPARGAPKTPAHPEKGVFALMDQDGDGRLACQEVVAYARFRLEERDINHDGKATAGEQRASAERYFRAADGNGDGSLTVEEYLLYWLGPSRAGAPGEKPAGAKRSSFDHRDADGDGAISLAEDRAFRKRDFSNADADEDGILILEEYAAFLSKRHQEMDAEADGHLTREEILAWGVGGDHGTPAPRTLESPKPKGRGVFAAVDQDGNKRLTRDEFDAYGHFRASEEDVNGDGKADPAELRRITEMYFRAMDTNGDGFHTLEEHMFFWFGSASEAEPAASTP